VHSKNRPSEQIRALNERMKDLAARQGYIYLDYYPSMVDDRGHLREELSDDGIHPNRRAYAVMAPLVEQAIAAAMGIGHSRIGKNRQGRMPDRFRRISR
jgi:lysophospholipase L1-like esterase